MRAAGSGFANSVAAAKKEAGRGSQTVPGLHPDLDTAYARVYRPARNFTIVGSHRDRVAIFSRICRRCQALMPALECLFSHFSFAGGPRFAEPAKIHRRSCGHTRPSSARRSQFESSDVRSCEPSRVAEKQPKLLRRLEKQFQLENCTHIVPCVRQLHNSDT